MYLPRLVRMDDGQTIAYIGVSGAIAYTAQYEDISMVAAFIEAQETYGLEVDLTCS